MPRHPWISDYLGKKIFFFAKKIFYFVKIKFFFGKKNKWFGKIIIFFGKVLEFFDKIISTQRLKHRVLAFERTVLVPGPTGFSG